MNIELYGVLREAAGSQTLELDIELPITIGTVLERLGADYPALATHLPRVACAVGDVMRSRQDQLQPNETLVLLPPVSGG
mgnify:FL=1